MPRTLSDTAAYVVDQFGRFGIPLPEDSRIKRMSSVWLDCDDNLRDFMSQNDPDFSVALEALRDFSHLEFFFDQIQDDPERYSRREYIEALGRVVNDSVRPQDDSENTPGRDAQAELFFFAVCRSGGLSPRLEEPDITCELRGERFAVAVKRIKSESQLRERLGDGVAQIVLSRLPGFISADVTLAVNPENRYIDTNQSATEVRAWWTAKMRVFTQQYYGYRSSVLRGIFLHEHCPVSFGGSFKLRTMTYAVDTWQESWMESQWFALRATIIRGLPHLEL